MKQLKKQLMIGVIGLVSLTSLVLAQPNTSKKPLNPAKSTLNEKISQQQQTIQKQGLKLLSQQQLTKIEQQILTLEKQKLAIMQQAQVYKKQKVQYQWVKGTPGKVPSLAIIAWQNATGPVQICQSEYYGGMHPGQLFKKGCRISYEGKAFIQNQYNILTSNKPMSWKRPQMIYKYLTQSKWPRYGGVGPVIIGGGHQKLPMIQPVIGGHEEGHNLYICRGMYKNSVHIGKVIGDHCNIGSDGLEAGLSVYEVLFQDVAAEK